MCAHFKVGTPPSWLRVAGSRFFLLAFIATNSTHVLVAGGKIYRSFSYEWAGQDAVLDEFSPP